jgi:hypothetical protein
VGGTDDNPTIPSDDLVSRIDAMTLVGGALGYDAEAQADYLADCALGPLGHGRVEWTSQNEIIIDYVAGPFPGQKTGRRSPSPEQLEQAIRSRLWEHARRGAPGVHVKGDLAIYRAAVIPVPKPFDGWRLDAWQLESAPEEGATPAGPQWTVEIKFKLIKFRLSQLVAVLREDGGLLEAGLERLRSLGRLPPSTLATTSSPPKLDLADPPHKRGQTRPWVEAMSVRHSQGLDEDGFLDLLESRGPSVCRKTLANNLSLIVNETPRPGEPPVWRGKTAKVVESPSPRRAKRKAKSR